MLASALHEQFVLSASAGMPLGVGGQTHRRRTGDHRRVGRRARLYHIAPLPTPCGPHLTGPSSCTAGTRCRPPQLNRSTPSSSTCGVSSTAASQRAASDHRHGVVGSPLMGRRPISPKRRCSRPQHREVAKNGHSASVVGVAKLLGAPSGSVYHRFPTRDALIAAAWLDALRDFQSGFLAALAQPDLDAAAVDAATHVPRWCGRQLDCASPPAPLPARRPRRRLARGAWPGNTTWSTRAQFGAYRQHARDRYGHATGVALDARPSLSSTSPGPFVRRFLDQRRRPPRCWSIDAVAAATLAILRSNP